MMQKYSRPEKIADGIVHCVAILAALIAVVAMMVCAIKSLPALASTSLAIYGAGLLAAFGCSAAYNLLPMENWRSTLRRFDQAAIFLKIAGTYTPFALVKMGGVAGMTLLGSVWTVAIVGSASKLLRRDSRDAIDIALYLALGWAGLIALGPLSASVTRPVLLLLAIGGVLYSTGIIFHVWHQLKYQNVIWHSFVLAGTCCHFGAVNAALFGYPAH